MLSNDDDNQGVVMAVLFGLIALVISLVIGLAIYTSGKNKATDGAASTTEPAAAPAATAALAGPQSAAAPVAPAAAPSAGDDGSKSARVGLVAFVNGQTGANNPQRQGLNSALMGDGDPLNVLRRTPNQGGYSPLWDVFPAACTEPAIAAGLNLRQTGRSEL